MVRVRRSGVKLPSSLQQAVHTVWQTLHRGAPRAELEACVANLHEAFMRALDRGHVTRAQERAFADHLRDICAAVEQQESMPV